MTESTFLHLDQNNANEIAALFVGRRIVRAEKGDVLNPSTSPYHSTAEGLLVLDDGTELYLTGNDGCGGCSSGWYDLERVAAVDNIITSARVHCSPDDDYGIGEGVYQIFVVADAVEINVASFEGTDGNGYYGTGFSLTVVPPELARKEAES